MSFVIKRPFAVSSQAFKQFSKTPTIIRAFHASPLKSNASPFINNNRAASSSLLKSRTPTIQSAFKRTYAQQTWQAPAVNRGPLMQRLLYGGAIVGGTILATNLIFNRETREDGGMPGYERDYLNQTFLHTGLGIGIIGVAARALHTSGWSHRLMAFNPWVVIGVSLVASIGTMYGTFYTAPEK